MGNMYTRKNIYGTSRDQSIKVVTITTSQVTNRNNPIMKYGVKIRDKITGNGRNKDGYLNMNNHKERYYWNNKIQKMKLETSPRNNL